MDAMAPNGPLVGTDWLAARLGRPGVVVLDASVGGHRDARERIPGVRVFDIDGAMSEPFGPLPHTMPDTDRFTEEMRGLGVDDSDTLVVYDGAGIYSSARTWWMLRAMGFDRACGGLRRPLPGTLPRYGPRAPGGAAGRPHARGGESAVRRAPAGRADASGAGAAGGLLRPCRGSGSSWSSAAGLA
jgi:thiosulfate/3-mercaptopyruvate sulfurtransferase